MASVTDYQSLVTSQHADKPRFMAMVAATVAGYAGVQAVAASLVVEFDIDHAYGDRLDTIGVVVGLDRNLRPVSPGAYVQAPPDVAPLSDSDYAVLLRGKIMANQWDGTTSGAYAVLQNALGPASRVFTVDNQDMSMLVCVAGAVPPATFKAALSGGYMGIKPATVRVNFRYPTGPGGPLLGLGVHNQFIAGLGTGVWASRT